MQTDTIAAIATAPGRAGVGIIRLSGKHAVAIAKTIMANVPPVNVAKLRRFVNSQGDVIDEGLVLYFKQPNSFTGEDVVELHAHGGPVVLDMLLNLLIQSGARIAKPGEFTERAFLNDKLDLAQAEAIADLIDASSQQAVIAAQRSLQGEFSAKVYGIVEELIKLRVYVEAAIDFPEEEIDFLSDGRISTDVVRIKQKLQQILSSAQQGALLREGMQLVLAGLPNAGKSSLLNCLSGSDTAIVTDQPGTTRDVLSTTISLDGLPLHIIDTAGLRDSADIIEQEGVKRAWQQINQAHRILYVVDSSLGLQQQDSNVLDLFPTNIKITLVFNKLDLIEETAELIENSLVVLDKIKSNIDSTVQVSTVNGVGIDGLKKHLKQAMGYQNNGEGVYLARRRHLAAVEKALHYVRHGEEQLKTYQAGELLAADLFEAQNQLASITGKFTSDDLLGEIFSSFCIGK